MLRSIKTDKREGQNYLFTSMENNLLLRNAL